MTDRQIFYSTYHTCIVLHCKELVVLINITILTIPKNVSIIHTGGRNLGPRQGTIISGKYNMQV